MSLPKIQLKAKSKYGETITQIRRHCDEGIQAFQALQRPPAPAQVNILDRCKGRRLRCEFLKLVMIMVIYRTLHKKTTTYPYDGIRNSGFRAPWLWAWLLCGNSSRREYKKKASVFGYVIGKNIIKIWKEKASNTNNKKEILIWK